MVFWLLIFWSEVGRFGAESILCRFSFLGFSFFTIFQPNSLFDWCGPDRFFKYNPPWRGLLDIFLVHFLFDYGWPFIDDYFFIEGARWSVRIFVQGAYCPVGISNYSLDYFLNLN